MKYRNRWIVAVVVLMIASLQLSACMQTVVDAGKQKPANVEKIAGSEFNHVVLTEKAAQRLDIQTAPVREEQLNGTQRKVIPYAAVVYGLNGETWAYISPGPLVFR